MKKNLLLSVAIMATFSSLAQPNLTSATTNPVIGDKFYSHECQKTGVFKGIGGANAVWNFHDLKAVYVFSDSTIYIPCDATPNHMCDSVGGASMASKMSNGGYRYYAVAGNKYGILGEVYPGEYWHYSRLFTGMVYPMSLDSIAIDSFYKYEPMLGESVAGQIRFQGDGYGKLSIPSGDYDNVLRVHVTTTYAQITGYPGVPSTVTGSYEEYRWYAAGIHSPLLVITYDGSNTNGLPSSVYYYMLKPFADAVTDVNNYVGDVAVSPNPADDMVHISLDSKSKCTARISVIDMFGRVCSAVKEEEIQSGKNSFNCNVSQLPIGMYVVRIETPAGAIQEKVMVAR